MLKRLSALCALSSALILANILGLNGPFSTDGIKWFVAISIIVFYIQHVKQKLSGDDSKQGQLASPSREKDVAIPEIVTWKSASETLEPHMSEVKKSQSYLSVLSCCYHREAEEQSEEAVASRFASAHRRAGKAFSPTVPGVDVVDRHLIQALRLKLVDLLGEFGASTPTQIEATATIERFGGEHSCFSRFLRARQLDVDLAEKMLRDTIEFRREHTVNRIWRDSRYSAVWRSHRKHWPMTAPVFTGDCSLVIYSRMAHFIQIFRKGYTEKCLRDIYLCFMERSLRLQHEGRRRRGQLLKDEMPPVYEIYDLQGIGREHFACLIGLRMLPRVLSIGQKHYPENLRTALILNAPPGFESIWNMIRSVLHERTQAKIHITRGDGRQLLSLVLGIDEQGVDRILASIVPYAKEEANASSTSPRKCAVPGADLMDWLEQSDLVDI